MSPVIPNPHIIIQPLLFSCVLNAGSIKKVFVSRIVLHIQTGIGPIEIVGGSTLQTSIINVSEWLFPS